MGLSPQIDQKGLSPKRDRSTWTVYVSTAEKGSLQTKIMQLNALVSLQSQPNVIPHKRTQPRRIRDTQCRPVLTTKSWLFSAGRIGVLGRRFHRGSSFWEVPHVVTTLVRCVQTGPQAGERTLRTSGPGPGIRAKDDETTPVSFSKTLFFSPAESQGGFSAQIVRGGPGRP